jgi:hypothetical protein
MKDEKILKKISKLLSLYGVSEEEKNNFLTDLQDKKYDDEETEEVGEVAEEVSEEEIVEEQPEQLTDEMVENEEVEELEEQEEPTEIPQEEEIEEPVEEVEQPMELEEEVVEQEPVVEEEQKDIETEIDFKSKYDELKKSFDGLVARLETLEGLVSKLGVEEPEEEFGLTPNTETAKDDTTDTFDFYNRLRTGR